MYHIFSILVSCCSEGGAHASSHDHVMTLTSASDNSTELNFFQLAVERGVKNRILSEFS